MPVSSTDDPHFQDETSKFEVSDPATMVDYSVLFGEDFQIPDDHWDMSIVNILDLGAVEEGIFHVLYACASQVDYHDIFFDKLSVSVMSSSFVS